MKPEYITPEDIERRSFEIIKSELPHPVDPDFEPIILRAVHTTADFDYVDSLSFSEKIVGKAIAALKKGTMIISDTNMVKSGIDKIRLSSLGGEVQCFITDEDVIKVSDYKGITRAAASVDKASDMGVPIIFAVGNAPTALLRICELKEQGKFSPEFVIGVPVGFVNVTESKEALMRSGIPYITARGRKGGSNVAAAICNALIRMSEKTLSDFSDIRTGVQ